MSQPRRKTHREAAVQIVRVLQKAGHVAYLAGGCVRDDLLGIEPKDFDVATDAKPEKVKQLFARSRLVGEAFGVVLVRLYGHMTDVATFRSEWGYEDGRHPTHVHFTDAQHDAQRRDFTINGLFEDPLAVDPSQRFIDYVGGRCDLEARVVRAIGDARQRFAEDYLRMLRAVRFASRLGFEIEAGTKDAIQDLAPSLARISRERIGQELSFMLTAGRPSLELEPATPPDQAAFPHSSWRAIQLIEQLGLDKPILDESSRICEWATVRRLTCGSYALVLGAWLLDRHYFGKHPDRSPVIQAFGRTRDASVGGVGEGGDRFHAFVADELETIVRRWRRALCLSNDERDALRHVVERLSRVARWSSLSLAKRKRLVADTRWSQVWALFQATCHEPEEWIWFEQIAQEVNVLAAQVIAPPWVDGYDLIKMGLKPGPGFKRLLDEVYDAQLEGQLEDRKAALQWVRRGISDGDDSSR